MIYDRGGSRDLTTKEDIIMILETYNIVKWLRFFEVLIVSIITWLN